MKRHFRKDLFILEACVIIVCVGLTCMLYALQGYKMVVLNLFFLPIVLTGCYLGRYRAGLVALFSVLSASLVAAMNLDKLAAYSSPLVLALSVAVWAAVLGLTAMLVGTLSDERLRKTAELHEAYLGVVEVLSQYLQSAHPRMKGRAIRVAEIGQNVAEKLRLSPKQIDDIRVAALLYDMGDVEITARVIRQAVGTLEADSSSSQHTFQGKDLVLSLGSVLRSAMPLLIGGRDVVPESVVTGGQASYGETPVGVEIIRVARDYDALTESVYESICLTPEDALTEMRGDASSGYDPLVLAALQRVVDSSAPQAERELQLAT